MTAFQTDDTKSLQDRRTWMGLLARASATDLLGRMPANVPAYDFLRMPEVGSVMVQGRTGAIGAPFNLGEMTVTRCVLRLASGEVGHAHVQGRDKAHATRAAVIDALMQTADALAIQDGVLGPLAALEVARKQARAERAAATRVEFFTLVRGEDQ